MEDFRDEAIQARITEIDVVLKLPDAVAGGTGYLRSPTQSQTGFSRLALH